MKLDLVKLYTVIRPILLILCLLWLVLNPLTIFVENEISEYGKGIEVLLTSVQVFYYILTIGIVYFVSLMEATVLLKVIICIGILFVFPPISMLLLLIMDKGLIKGIEIKKTSANKK